MDKSYSHEKHGGSRTHTLQTQNRSASAQLKKDKSKIKATWEKRVRDKIHSADSQTSLALLNSIDIFLDELITALELSTLESPSDPGKKGMTKSHGGQRAKFAGYFLPQLLEEFSILREVILGDLNSEGLLTYQVGLIINSAIDSAISLAATEFTAVQQKARQDALEKAEESNRDLEHFAAVAAHDLKSPLATISAYSDVLLDDANSHLTAESRNYIDVMQRTTRRMADLIDRLLDFARLKKGEKQLHLIDLNEVMKSVLQNLDNSIRATHAKITCGHLPAVHGDFHLLNQVFQNLIANSLKFHGEKDPVIQIDCKERHGEFQFALTDNGIGFDSKDREGIFALYKKLRGESEYEGAGIGLATCKKVVELHGGRIWAESQMGVGSTFYFTIPKPAALKNNSHH